MMELGPLAFLSPWVLSAVVVLPVIWLLLRVVPPAPRKQTFPPLRLLKGLTPRERSAARTPPWLLLLRLLAVFLAIIGLARPIYDPQASAIAGSPLLIVVDDGWDAAAAWERRQEAVHRVLDDASRNGRPIQLLTTAAPADGELLALGRLGTAEEARDRLRALEPKPWAADHAAALDALRNGSPPANAEVLWVTSGLQHGASRDLAVELQRLGSLTVMVPPSGQEPVMLLPPERLPDGLALTLRRMEAPSLQGRALTVRAMDTQGRAVAAAPVSFAPGAAEAQVHLPLPPDLRNGLGRLEAAPAGASGAQGAASVILLDESWRRRPVGIVSGDPERAGVPLLSDTYYVERALAPYADVRRGEMSTLLDQKLSVMMLTGGQTLSPERAATLDGWVRDGGVLVRFAGSSLAEAGGDELLPVGIRGGGRTLGGVLSWSSPMTLAPFSDESPFAGLPVPEGIQVNSQVLAEPSADLPEKTWARLQDGTPLVTGQRMGDGWLVLVHTTSNAEWSDLPMSGLFPEMLRRLTALGQGIGEVEASDPLPPLEILDGFGRLGEPAPAARPLPRGPEPVTVGPRHPPGWYGTGDMRTAVNLASPAMPLAAFTDLPPGVSMKSLAAEEGNLDLRVWFLTGALLLLLADMAASYALRGVVPFRRRRATAAVVLLALIPLAAGIPSSADAAEGDPPAIEAALNTRLAYVATGDGSVDRISRLGLASLTRVLASRSSAELADPMEVDINSDELVFFPMLYWPAVDGQILPDARAVTRITEYLDHGGMIIFDGRGPENAEALRTLLRAVEAPPLQPLPEDHVLNRSFYLTRGLPGRVDSGTVWLEQGAARLDGVSPVIVGSNDWAGAWARDDQNRPLMPVVPGGERAREAAYRSGVNMVMYALTGNYKADQVHLPAIMERLTQ